MRAAAECVDDEIALAGIKKHDDARLGLEQMELSKQTVALEGTLSQSGADHSYVRRMLLQASDRIARIHGTSHDDDAGAFRTKDVFDHLAVQETRLGEQDIDRLRDCCAFCMLHLRSIQAVWKG